MRLLELFAGTGSVHKAVGDQFAEVVSLDILSKWKPTIVSDIMEWDYRVYPTDHFDVIWASPPCTHYSVAKTRGVRDIEGSNRIVARVLEIIEYFSPRLWFMENPQTGLLKSQDVVSDVPYYDVDYCQYGMNYRKRTRIWTNKKDFAPLLCDRTTCQGMVETAHGKRHKWSCGNGHPQFDKTMKLAEKYIIPESLVKALFL